MTHAHIDFGDEADRLVDSARAQADRSQRLAAQIVTPDDHLVLDVGCGGGGMAVAMARQQPSARVVGLDAEPAVLDAARRYAASENVAVEFAQVDLDDGAAALGAAVGAPADVIWCAGVVHHAADQQEVLNDLAGRLAPAGRLVLAEGGLGPRHLPRDLGIGRPSLETRLDEAGERWFAALRANTPGGVPMPYGWNVAMMLAGLADVTLLQDVEDWPPPLSSDQRKQVLHGLAARVGWFDEYLDDDDRSVWTTLLDPESEHWLGRRDDIYKLGVSTIYIGRSADNAGQTSGTAR